MPLRRLTSEGFAPSKKFQVQVHMGLANIVKAVKDHVALKVPGFCQNLVKVPDMPDCVHRVLLTASTV